MEAEWAHKTNVGRVVYNRRLHRFTGKDAIRVARSYVEDPFELQPNRQKTNKRDRLTFVLAGIADSYRISLGLPSEREALTRMMFLLAGTIMLESDIVDAVNQLIDTVINKEA